MADLQEPAPGSIVAAGGTVFLREEDDQFGAAWRKVGHLTTYRWVDVLAVGGVEVVRAGPAGDDLYCWAPMPGEYPANCARPQGHGGKHRQWYRAREWGRPAGGEAVDAPLFDQTLALLNLPNRCSECHGTGRRWFAGQSVPCVTCVGLGVLGREPRGGG